MQPHHTRYGNAQSNNRGFCRAQYVCTALCDVEGLSTVLGLGLFPCTVHPSHRTQDELQSDSQAKPRQRPVAREKACHQTHRAACPAAHAMDSSGHDVKKPESQPDLLDTARAAKAANILDACNWKDVAALRTLAASEGGLVWDELRRRACSSTPSPRVSCTATDGKTQGHCFLAAPTTRTTPTTPTTPRAV